MALTISDLGNGVSAVAGTTLATGATITASVGDALLVIVGASNDGTTPSAGASSISGVVDSDGVNTYDAKATINYDPGAAGAGATLAFYLCIVAAALSSDTITVNFSPSTSERSVQVYKIVPSAGKSISTIAVDGTGVTGNFTTYAATGVSVTSGDAIFGAAAIETDDAVTGDSDTTNGSWSAVLTRLADGGADASTMSCVSQYKITTGTGTQNWAATTATGRDSAISYIIIGEISNSGTLSKTLNAVTLSSTSKLSITGTFSKTLDAMTLNASSTLTGGGGDAAVAIAMSGQILITGGVIVKGTS